MSSGSSSLQSSILAIWEKVHSPNGLPFPETVAQLRALGVVRYHVSYIAGTATSYIRDGSTVDVVVSPLHLPSDLKTSPSTSWNGDAVTAAIRKAQRLAANGEGKYLEFAKECVDAGVTDYMAYLEGKRVVYFGLHGDLHVEWFPGAGPVGDK